MSGLALYPPSDVGILWDEQPRVPGASFINVYQGNGLITLFTAAANVNGALLRTFTLGTSTGAYWFFTIWPTAPAAVTDTTRRALARGYGAASGPQIPLLADRPILIPAGLGAFVYSSGAGIEMAATWDFL